MGFARTGTAHSILHGRHLLGNEQNETGRGFRSGAKGAGFSRSLEVRALASDNQWFIEIDGLELAKLLDVKVDGFGEAVEPQRILLQTDDVQQTTLQLFELHRVRAAFEYRLLHALADSLASSCDLAQALSAGARFGGDVVANDDEHGLARKERQVGFGFAAQGARQQPRLDLWKQTQGYFGFQQRMSEHFLFLFLPGYADRTTRIVRQ